MVYFSKKVSKFVWEDIFSNNSYVHTSESSRTWMRAQLQSGSSRQVKKMDAGMEPSDNNWKIKLLYDGGCLILHDGGFRDDPLHKFLVS